MCEQADLDVKESCSVICFPPSAIAVPKLIVVLALGLFVCTHHPQGTNVFLNSYASCYVFTLGDADKRVRNGKILCVADLGL